MSDLTRLAKHLRGSSTDAEPRLWTPLRARRFQDLKFRRQQSGRMGKASVRQVGTEFRSCHRGLRIALACIDARSEACPSMKNTSPA
ncbi:MAG: DUF559 domain-containing protein [Candidatus Thiosymbion ectosymbiont of Robbea hypermnestra]|nr:DUF559 domain-containing protein [Candidatus Thiosymbion ectosymbiont of Robbea hypermnestra]